MTRKSTTLDRRSFLGLGVGAALAGIAQGEGGVTRPRILFVHGRDQQGKNPAQLEAQWIAALKEGARKLRRPLPANLEVAFPYYGATLAQFVRDLAVPLASDIKTRGGKVDSADQEFLKFQAEVGEEVRQTAGVSDEQVIREYGQNPKPRGPLNWEWVQAVLRAVDKHGGGIKHATLEAFTRDVFLYTTRPAVRDEIDKIVKASMTAAPTVVVAHSLGSVVAYSVLRSDPGAHIPLLVTVGSPLALRAIRDHFSPLKYPAPVETWFNAYDTRDVVALYPLDEANFAVPRPIDNFGDVKNHTDNRHGIKGYLDDGEVAKRILDGLDDRLRTLTL